MLQKLHPTKNCVLIYCASMYDMLEVTPAIYRQSFALL